MNATIATTAKDTGPRVVAMATPMATMAAMRTGLLSNIHWKKLLRKGQTTSNPDLERIPKVQGLFFDRFKEVDNLLVCYL